MLRERSPNGDREFIRLLMLHRDFAPVAVEAAVAAALRSGAVHLEAVRDHLLGQIRASKPPATYTAELDAIRVQQPALRQYDGLLKRGAVH
jgi:hypothetical protein